MRILGGIEAGGTKFIMGVGSGPKDLITAQAPTTTPEATIREAIAFFEPYAAELDAIGIGSFGPVDLHWDSPTFGHITSTPKPGWQNVDLAGAIRNAFHVPIAFDTDVNAAALGEGRWGSARGLTDFLYLTIGTGIGGGAISDGRVLHGLVHTEMGHIRMPHDLTLDPFPGRCPYHGDCLEGLACGPAMEDRWGMKARELPPDHPAWALEARYLGQALATWVCTLSPQRILMGGGVMQQEHLFPLVRAELLQQLNGYVQAPEILERIEEYIMPPELGGRAGILGSLVLASQASSIS